jgi:hypothetical protein
MQSRNLLSALRRGGAATILCIVAAVTTIAIAAPTPFVPRAPEYSQSDSWAAWPGRPSGADVVPPGVMDSSLNERARVDVFFVHPTTYMSGSSANAHFDELGATSILIDRGVLRSQASAFNHCCRIYAPHYRQAALATFFHRDDALDSAALDLAYGDVLRAFDYYLAHENHGRPFIIAGHSQGSLHVLRLLQERIAGSPLQQRLVAAYVVGYFVPQEIERTGLIVCRSPAQTGCIVSWNTVKSRVASTDSRTTHLVWLDGRYQRLGERPVVCINPLSWTPDSDAPAELNLGALPGVHPSQALRPVVPALTGAECENGQLTVAIPFGNRHGFADALTLFGSYHIYDYNLFYSNIRTNASERTSAFFAH